MEEHALTYFYPKKDWKGAYGFDCFKMWNNLVAWVPLNPTIVHLEGTYTEDGYATYKRQLGYEEEPNREMATAYLQHSLSNNKWFVHQKDGEWYFYFPMPLGGSTSEIVVKYFDGHCVTYNYQDTVLSGVTFKDSQETERVFYGSSEIVVSQVQEAGIKVINELLNCPFYCQIEQVHLLDEGICHIEINMKNAQSVKCHLLIQKEDIPLCFSDLGKNAGGLRAIELMKVMGGKAHVPVSKEHGEAVFADIEFDAALQQFDESLVPLWRDSIDKGMLLVDNEEQVVLYPVPTLSMVKYHFGDKRNGLKNGVVSLQVQTVGVFEEIYFEYVDSDEIGNGKQLGSTKNAVETLTLFSKNAVEGPHLIRAYDSNKNETGRLNVFVFAPIHLKICFVKVGYHTVSLCPSGGFGWDYRDDQFIEIFGQAGVIFDDIAESFMELEGVPEKWDPELKDDLVDDYGMNLNSYLDCQFISTHPEYTGHYRVYILNSYKLGLKTSEKLHLIIHQVNVENPMLGGLVVFKKSIEAADAKRSNPLAHGLLSSMGLNLQVGYDKDNDVSIELLKGTTNNVMDQTEYRYSLTSNQWLAIRKKAAELRGQLDAALKKQKRNDRNGYK